MFLAIDIGNSNITLGIFDNDTLIKTIRLDSDKNLSVFEYEKLIKNALNNFNIKECAMLSVVEELTEIVKSACENIFKTDIFILNSNSKTGLLLDSSNSATIGADRLANACAVLDYKLPAIIVDIGTAITFDIVDSDKSFIGGVIMSGINMELKALYENTSKLPLISAKESDFAIGNTTESCILSGVIRGNACAIEGLLNQCEKELNKKVTVVATGGQCNLISKYMSRKFDYIDSNFTLRGLKRAYKISKQNKSN